MSQRLDTINREMLKEFNKRGIEDTPENRLAFLTGLQQSWQEDPVEEEYLLDKLRYMMTLTIEINRLAFRVKHPNSPLFRD